MSKRTRTTSDHATDRMLWAPLRLSVRGAGTQLRYGRLAGPARRVRGAPGFSGLGCWGADLRVSGRVIPVRPHTFRWCWDGIACEAGVRKRPPHDSDRIGPYTQHLYPETCGAPAPCGTAGSRPARKNRRTRPTGKAERPGEDPGPFG